MFRRFPKRHYARSVRSAGFVFIRVTTHALAPPQGRPLQGRPLQGGQPVPANIATYFILAGGLAGIAMGLFGLAPLVFQRRLGRRSEAQRLQEERIYAREMAMAADEASRATAWGVLVGSRRTSHGPAGIDRPQPFEPAVPNLAGRTRS